MLTRCLAPTTEPVDLHLPTMRTAIEDAARSDPLEIKAQASTFGNHSGMGLWDTLRKIQDKLEASEKKNAGEQQILEDKLEASQKKIASEQQALKDKLEASQKKNWKRLRRIQKLPMHTWKTISPTARPCLRNGNQVIQENGQVGWYQRGMKRCMGATSD